MEIVILHRKSARAGIPHELDEKGNSIITIVGEGNGSKI
jgi:hypothetical protein